ncbi:MAG: glycosyltransferase family 9 protein [Cytophagales bacterium]|nr:glycosyltransferase family 9 protein [Armatimonadota bacterium]
MLIRPPASPDSSRLHRVLLVKLSSLGDVVHALPLADALRAGLGPSVEIVWAVRDRFADLLCGNPNLSTVTTLRGHSLGDLIVFGRTLRQGGKPFDAALDAQGLLKSGVVTWLSHAPLRIGLDLNREGSALFLTHPVVPAKARAHMVEKLMGFCDVLGIARPAPRPQQYLADGQREAARALLGEATGSGPIVGGIVGASTPEKAWPPERWAMLVGILRGQGVRLVLLGGAGERETAARITEMAGGVVAADLVGRTPLKVLASVLAQCDVVIGGDSGPTHLAVAVGTPVVGLYGVTDPVRTGPQWGAGRSIVLDYAEGDAPPEARRPRRPTLGDSLARIPAEAAAEAAKKLL